MAFELEWGETVFEKGLAYILRSPHLAPSFSLLGTQAQDNSPFLEIEVWLLRP